MDETDNIAKFKVTGDDGETFHVVQDFGRVRFCWCLVDTGTFTQIGTQLRAPAQGLALRASHVERSYY